MNSASTDQVLLQRIQAFALTQAAEADPAHDELHLRRVVANARGIMGNLPASASVDRFVVEAACWLHDCVHLPKGQTVAGEAARRSADRASAFMESLGLNAQRIRAVHDAVLTHSFSGGLNPATIEAAIVQDADRLDALGAIGIARLWATMVSMGGAMYHRDDPAGSSRDLDDRSWALDHVERKLFRLPALMNTEAGRAEAERRAAFLRTYLDEFLREIGALRED